MKQPDTAALRERLANYTPEEELKQDMQELDGLLQEVNCLIVGLRNLLNEIQALKEELHGIHGSLKHTVQRERAAFKAPRHTRQPKAHRPTGTGGLQGSGSSQGKCRQHCGRYQQRHCQGGTKHRHPC